MTAANEKKEWQYDNDDEFRTPKPQHLLAYSSEVVGTVLEFSQDAVLIGGACEPVDVSTVPIAREFSYNWNGDVGRILGALSL